MKGLIALLAVGLMLAIQLTACGIPQEKYDKAISDLQSLQTQYDQLENQNDSLLTQLTQCQQNATELQTQLTQCQQNATELQTQLTQCQQELATCQEELDELKSPPLTPSPPVILSGPVYSGCVVSIPIELNQFEEVQGEILGGVFHAYIKDPQGGTVQDFGTIQQSNFKFTAQISGRYTIVFQNTNTTLHTAYKLRYVIYRR